MPTQVANAHGAWESAEIGRSAYEAKHTPAERLIADPAVVARYASPPSDTAYPLEYAYALVGDVRGKTVLDFGCGSGENSLLLAARGASVIGVDISEDLIRLAERRMATNGVGDRARFAVGSAHDLPLADDSVDIVFGIAILHHLDLAASSREIFRVLKPGGLAVFQEPVRDSAAIRAVRRLIPYQAPDVSPYERPLMMSEIKAFSSGFDAVACRAFSLPFVNIVQVVPQLRPLVHKAYAIDRRLLRSVPPFSKFAGIRVIGLRKPTSPRPVPAKAAGRANGRGEHTNGLA